MLFLLNRATFSPTVPGELRANASAGHFLMPEREFRQCWNGLASSRLDTPVRVDDPVGTRLVVEFQELTAGGRPLIHAAVRRGGNHLPGIAGTQLRPLMLSDDYDARVAAKSRNDEPFSVYKLLHLMIKQGKDRRGADTAYGFRMPSVFAPPAPSAARH